MWRVLTISFFLVGCSFFSSAPNEPSGQQLTYKVRRGDTLYEISQRFAVQTSELQELNGISNPRRLQVGTVLRLPKRAVTRGRASYGYTGARTNKQAAAPDIAPFRGKLLWPLPRGSARLSSPFGWRRGRFHEGADFAARRGTVVFAAHSGRVVYSGSSMRGYGNMIVIQAEGIMTVYAHNRRNFLRAGQRVERGERIAEVGASGNANGAHLHFEVRLQNSAGRYIAYNPLLFY